MSALRATTLAAISILLAIPAATLQADRAIGQYTVASWQASHGLPQESVQAIYQSRDGYLWVGTLAGLARFDGVAFTTFDKRNTPAIRDNAIQSIVEDRHGDLWIATGGGGIVRYRNGRFDVFDEKQGATSETIWSLLVRRNGELWAGSLRHGIFIFRGGKFEKLVLAGFPDPLTALTLYEDREGVLWVGTEHNGLYRVAGTTVTHEDLSGRGLPETVRAIAEDASGTLWIGTDDGLYRRAAGGFERYTTREGLPSDLVRAIFRDAAGSLWIGTYGGLARFRGGALEPFPSGRLPSAIIRCLYQDREKNLWLGTGGGGIARLKESIAFGITERDGLRNNSVRAILEGRGGEVWVGTYGGGIACFRDGALVASYTTKDGLLDDIVFSLTEARDGTLWIGTSKGVSRLRDGRFVNLTRAEGLPGEVVRAIYADREGSIWIGTVSGGLSRFRDGKLVTFTAADGLSGDSIFWITQTRDGAIWAATYGGGLNRLANGRFRVYRTADGLPTDRVWSIYEDRDGVLWLGTRGGGLVRMKNGRFARIQMAQGLFDDVVYSVVEDDRGNLWMSGNRGIWRAEKTQLDAVADGRLPSLVSYALGRADGLPSSEGNGGSQPSSCKTRDGRLWFSTIGGVAVIEPHAIEEKIAPPIVIIERVVADGRELPSASVTRVPAGTRQLEVRYTGLSLGMPERVRFRYQLEGYDTGWTDAGPRRSAYFTRVPPGKYTLLVVATIDGQSWSKGSTIAIELLPRIWQTRPFVATIALAAVLAVWVAYRWRVRSLRLRAAELAALVEQQTRELRVANSRLYELSRADGLTGVANRRHFDETLDREWRRALRDAHPLSLLLIDIDRFKSYNDLKGHVEGDETLRRIASTLGLTVRRAGDLVARYGGEEFAVVLPATPADRASEIAETVRRSVESLDIQHPQGGPVTVSIGVATVIPRLELVSEALVAAADEMLYEAKKRGRNGVVAVELKD